MTRHRQNIEEEASWWTRCAARSPTGRNGRARARSLVARLLELSDGQGTDRARDEQVARVRSWSFQGHRGKARQVRLPSLWRRRHRGSHENATAVEVGCWSHAQRYFVKAVDIDKHAAIAIEKIKKMYKIEREATDHDLHPLDRLRLRHEKTKPALESLATWADETRPFAEPKSPPGGTRRGLVYGTGDMRAPRRRRVGVHARRHPETRRLVASETARRTSPPSMESVPRISGGFSRISGAGRGLTSTRSHHSQAD